MTDAKPEVKKVDKTAESGGIRNVGPVTDPASPEFKTPDTSIEQASATVPGSEAAAEKAFPDDDTVAKLQKVAPTYKTFTEVKYERERAARLGESLEPNPPYGNPNNRDGAVPRPSKKTEEETARGSQAQGEAGGFQEPLRGFGDPGGRLQEAIDRNLRAEQQMAKVVDEANEEKKRHVNRK